MSKRERDTTYVWVLIPKTHLNRLLKNALKGKKLEIPHPQILWFDHGDNTHLDVGVRKDQLDVLHRLIDKNA